MTSATFHGRNDGVQIGIHHGPFTVEFHQAHASEAIDRICLQNLRCPDSLAVKNRLKETKDKLLRQSFEWVLQNPQYHSWRNGNDICLLWIKGGAGKGKTMMTIGLIEVLSQRQDTSTVVTYFFCQNVDNELNTLESLIKGLILRLISQRVELKESLRRRWDSKNDCFSENINSWRALWGIFLEMLDKCNCSRIYIIMDALDECQDNSMADFLKLLVRNGLDQPTKIKWLLTSRPLEAAERILLSGHEQMQISLELNLRHISQSVQTYISYKVDELNLKNRYGEAIRGKLKTELSAKAEGIFLWVSLVCKRLEDVCADEALTTIQDLPPGLHSFYNQILNQLSEGQPDEVHIYMRLLKAMTLAFRPLKVEEIPIITGLSCREDTIKILVNHCASFVRMQGNSIEFVHQSARDYLAENEPAILDSYGPFDHYEIVLECLSYLCEHLKVNLIGLARPDSTKDSVASQKNKRQHSQLSSLDYATIFWVQHLQKVPPEVIAQNRLIEEGVVGVFLYSKLLEWLECFSLLDRLPRAIASINALLDVTKEFPTALAFMQDATRFLRRHYYIIARWPLQIYSSALIFSPKTSIVRTKNLDKLPVYFKIFSGTEISWASLIQTLEGHSDWVRTIAFSPDGKHIVSGSSDNTIKLWDTAIGDLEKTLEGHSSPIQSVIFSPDGKQIVSGSDDNTIKFWNSTTGDLQKTLEGHSSPIQSVIFSPDGKKIVSGSWDNTIKLWDSTTGDLQKSLEDHSSWIRSVAFSPDGEQIASGSDDNTIKIWNSRAQDLQKTLEGHSDGVQTVAFSPDGKQIVSGSDDNTIKFWNSTTGDLQKTLEGHSDWVRTVVFSPDGKFIVSGSSDNTIKLWDTTTGELQKTLEGHSSPIQSVIFSPDGKKIVSGSWDNTIKLWDSMAEDCQKTLENHSRCVRSIAFSPDGKQIASGSDDNTIKLWDTTTGDLQKTLEGHSRPVQTVAFSQDGKQIASDSKDHTIKLWDSTTGDLQKSLGAIQKLAISSDRTQIAYGSIDKTIKLLDIAKSHEASELLGNSLDNRLKPRSRTIKTSEPVYSLKFSADNQYLITGTERIRLEDNTTQDHNRTPHSLLSFNVKDQWICYGVAPFLRLPSDIQLACHDTQNDQVAIGLTNGQVLRFGFDRRTLHSVLR